MYAFVSCSLLPSSNQRVTHGSFTCNTHVYELIALKVCNRMLMVPKWTVTNLAGHSTSHRHGIDLIQSKLEWYLFGHHHWHFHFFFGLKSLVMFQLSLKWQFQKIWGLCCLEVEFSDSIQVSYCLFTQQLGFNYKVECLFIFLLFDGLKAFCLMAWRMINKSSELPLNFIHAYWWGKLVS